MKLIGFVIALSALSLVQSSFMILFKTKKFSEIFGVAQIVSMNGNTWELKIGKVQEISIINKGEYIRDLIVNSDTFFKDFTSMKLTMIDAGKSERWLRDFHQQGFNWLLADITQRETIDEKVKLRIEVKNEISLTDQNGLTFKGHQINQGLLMLIASETESAKFEALWTNPSSIFNLVTGGEDTTTKLVQVTSRGYPTVRRGQSFVTSVRFWEVTDQDQHQKVYKSVATFKLKFTFEYETMTGKGLVNYNPRYSAGTLCIEELSGLSAVSIANNTNNCFVNIIATVQTCKLQFENPSDSEASGFMDFENSDLWTTIYLQKNNFDTDIVSGQTKFYFHFKTNVLLLVEDGKQMTYGIGKLEKVDGLSWTVILRKSQSGTSGAMQPITRDCTSWSKFTYFKFQLHPITLSDTGNLCDIPIQDYWIEACKSEAKSINQDSKSMEISLMLKDKISLTRKEAIRNKKFSGFETMRNDLLLLTMTMKKEAKLKNLFEKEISVFVKLVTSETSTKTKNTGLIQPTNLPSIYVNDTAIVFFTFQRATETKKSTTYLMTDTKEYLNSLSCCIQFKSEGSDHYAFGKISLNTETVSGTLWIDRVWYGADTTTASDRRMFKMLDGLRTCQVTVHKTTLFEQLPSDNSKLHWTTIELEKVAVLPFTGQITTAFTFGIKQTLKLQAKDQNDLNVNAYLQGRTLTFFNEDCVEFENWKNQRKDKSSTMYVDVDGLHIEKDNNPVQSLSEAESPPVKGQIEIRAGSDMVYESDANIFNCPLFQCYYHPIRNLRK